MYTTIIHPLRKAYLLSINEYCVLEAVRGLANNTKYNGWCVMSQSRIAEALDLSLHTVLRCYNKLEDVNLIEKRKETEKDTAVRSVDAWNEWFMADKADMLLALKTNKNELITIAPRSVTSCAKMAHDHVPNCHIACAKMAHNTNKDTNIDTLKENIKEKAFETFWEAYPKKRGKGAAEKAFGKVAAVKLEVLLEAIEKQKGSHDWIKEEGQFIPNPSTWLNQKRWLDELSDIPLSFYEKEYEKLNCNNCGFLKKYPGKENILSKILNNYR